MFSPSPVHSMIFEGRPVFVKRDDLLHPEFSGNKARKFQHFLSHDFPHITTLVGSGSAQANSLYSLSVLAKRRGWVFNYYVDHLASYLKDNPQGNYQGAINHGANVIVLDSEERQGEPLEDYMSRLASQAKDNELHVPEGGRCAYAQEGLTQLGLEIYQWTLAQGLKELMVYFPSGTGTTAVFLQQYFNQMHPSAEHSGINIRVHTVSVVGGNEYLKKQFTQLCPRLTLYPKIHNTAKKYHFGKLYLECYQAWKDACAGGIEFELLYDPIGFIALKQLLEQEEFANTPILYLHQGGLLGNPSMLARYQRKYSTL
jgi:1-aminocyclopropane-1-carboxylate deaminase